MGYDAPDPATFRSEDWEHLITLKTPTARKKYYRYLFVKEERKKEQHEKKAMEKADRENLVKRPHNPHIYYGLGANALFMRIRPQTIAKWKNRK